MALSTSKSAIDLQKATLRRCRDSAEVENVKMTMPRKGSRRFVMWLVLFLLSFALMEASAFVAFRVLSGHWFSYTAMEQQRRITMEGAADVDAMSVGTRLGIEAVHPFLGFVYDPAKDGPGRQAHHRRPINEFGFLDEGPLVPTRSTDRFIVGIFGGSVAYWLSALGEESLRQGLEPLAGGRSIEFARHALGGYKQPQQLMTLAYYLALGAEYDLILNVDGFNELALSVENVSQGVFPHFPRNWHLRVGGAMNPQTVSAIGALVALEQKRAQFAEFFSAGVGRWSVVGNLVWLTYDRKLGFDIERQRATVQSTKGKAGGHDIVRHGPDRSFENDDALYDEVSRFWANSSLQMSKLARENGAEYLHVLQPNQYDPGSKPMAEAEQAVAVQPNGPYVERVVNGYPRLRARGRELGLRGVSFVDLTMLFSETEAPIYVDNCCHYNEEGNVLLANAVVESLLIEAKKRTTGDDPNSPVPPSHAPLARDSSIATTSHAGLGGEREAPGPH